MTTQTQDLAKRIEDARTAYYHGTPVMTDASYDALEDELRKLDPNHPLLSKTGAPVPASSGWQKVKHGIPMRSLNKAQTQGEMDAWTRNLPANAALLVTEKMDGISIALRYRSGKLTQALTRGDGKVGEDITRNVRIMQGVPGAAPSQKAGSFTGWVRGEIVVRKSDFAKHFPGDSNPRNTASGTAKRQSDFGPCRHLTVFAYQILPDNLVIASKLQELQVLRDHGFTVPNFEAVTHVRAGSVAALYQKYIDSTRAGLDYDIDGLVVEVDDAALREQMGERNHRPAGAIAFKFPHESKETCLRDIVWQVGNSGRVTPVAVFDEVELAGAKVKRASLHNTTYYYEIAGQIGQQVLTAGDTILVSRRNDVIPYVEAGIVSYDKDDTDDNILEIPTECPECGSRLRYEGEYLVCRNLDCPAQVSGAVKRWVKKLGVLDWGDAVIDALCESGRVKDPADLYTLEDDELSDLELSGRRVGSSAKRMLDNLHDKTELDLHVLVGSLGIPLISRSMAKTIVDGGYDTLDAMYKANAAELATIPGMGETKAEAFVGGLEERIGLACKLLTNGVKIKPPSTGAFKGWNVCMTGFRDPEMQDAIEAQGGTVKSGVSKKLDILVAKDPSSTSGKAKKARSYGVQIIGIEDMWTMLEGGKP